mmetsp:Transcript_16162/g.39688  ORF Transcript_16162/g.39688 Transcript_16162/m.39688 type:complete len:125 (-) Transcript_16162:832-1206(-)
MRAVLFLAALLAFVAQSSAYLVQPSMMAVRSQAVARSDVVMGANSGRKCQMTGRGPNNANAISFSHRVSSRKQQINLHTKKYFSTELNGWVRMKLATKTMKTIDKYGIDKTAKKYNVDLAKYRL